MVAVDPNNGTLIVRLDRGPETRDLPSWYLHDGNVDYGYAMTGHKAQGLTTGRAFVIVNGATDREWAYVALSRGRQANTLYLTNPEHEDEQCAHLTHPDRKDALDALTDSLVRTSAQTAAIDHSTEGRLSVSAEIDMLGSPPPSGDVAKRVDWIVARLRAERDELERREPGIELAAGR